jgi:hypothetical protein
MFQSGNSRLMRVSMGIVSEAASHVAIGDRVQSRDAAGNVRPFFTQER